MLVQEKRSIIRISHKKRLDVLEKSLKDPAKKNLN
jgi:hypothetical protein